jgi:hypothetical protein
MAVEGTAARAIEFALTESVNMVLNVCDARGAGFTATRKVVPVR